MSESDKVLLSKILISLFIAGAIAIIIVLIVSSVRKKKYKKALAELRRLEEEEMRRLANNSLAISPERFFEIRGTGTHHISGQSDFTGVYILYNKTKDKYYVGQATSVFTRVNNHFTGKGNGDVYADYKYGDEFVIRMISLKNSGMDSLNELKRKMIKHYNAYSSGYNRTRGNVN